MRRIRFVRALIALAVPACDAQVESTPSDADPTDVAITVDSSASAVDAIVSLDDASESSTDAPIDTGAVDGAIAESAVDSAPDSYWTFDASGFDGGTCSFAADAGATDLEAGPPSTSCIDGRGASSTAISCPSGSVCVLLSGVASSPYGTAPACVHAEDAVACAVEACGSIGCASPGHCMPPVGCVYGTLGGPMFPPDLPQTGSSIVSTV